MESSIFSVLSAPTRTFKKTYPVSDLDSFPLYDGRKHGVFLLFFEAEKLLQYIYLMRFYFRDKLGFIRVQMWRDDAVSTPKLLTHSHYIV